MASTEVAICNMALGRIGHSQSITTLADNTTEARACSRFYDDIRDYILASHHWRFATRRSDLTLATGVERNGWGYAYELPSDFIADQHIYAGARPSLVPGSMRIPYAIEHHLDGSDDIGILLTDDDAPELVYTARIETVSRFPPHFVSALVWHLASELALELTKKADVANGMLQRAGLELARAIAIDARSGQPDAPLESELITGR